MSDVSDINNESLKGTAAYQDEAGECQEKQSLAYDSLYSAQDRGTVLRPQTPPIDDNFNCLHDDMAKLSISGGGKQPESDFSLAIERQRLELDRFKEAHLQQQAMMSTSTSFSYQPTPHMPTHSFTNIPSNIREVSCPQQASSNVSNITSKSEALSRAYEMQRKEYERLQKEHMKRKQHEYEMVRNAALYNQKQQQQQSINHQEVTGSAAGRIDRSSAAIMMSSSLVQNDRGGQTPQTPQTSPPNYTSMDNHLESTHHTYPTRQGDRSMETISTTADEEEELSEEVFNHYLDVFNQTKFNPAPGF